MEAIVTEDMQKNYLLIVFFCVKTPTATAYEADKAIPSIFGLSTYSDCKDNYVCVTKSGGMTKLFPFVT